MTARAAKPSAVVDTRVIYCGDNLDQLKKLPDGCVDLIYINPPFNSNRNYEVFWGETIINEAAGRNGTDLRSLAPISMGTSAFEKKDPNTDFTDCADSAYSNPWNPYYYHLKSAKASQIFRVAFGYQCESVCICGSAFLVAASLRQVHPCASVVESNTF